MTPKVATTLGFKPITANKKTYYVYEPNKYPLLVTQEVEEGKDLKTVLYGTYVELSDKQTKQYIKLFKEANDKKW